MMKEHGGSPKKTMQTQYHSVEHAKQRRNDIEARWGQL